MIWVGIALLYGRVITFGFVNWDDYSYLHDNPLLRGAFLQACRELFSHFCFGNYFPLHLLSYLVEKSLFEHSAWVFHTTNILLHGFNACLLYVFFTMISGNQKISGLSAILFAVHPVHVESVAWISERKDVLFLFFLLLSAVLYWSYMHANKKTALFFSYIMYICSLLSKSSGVTFPLLLVVTCMYAKPWKVFKRHFISVIPFFVFAGSACVVQMIGGSLYGVWGDGYSLRTMVDSVIAYILHIVFPIGLSPRYARVFSMPWYVLSVLLVGGVAMWKKVQLFRWASIWFLCALLPVLHIVSIQILMADRYLYLAACPLYFLFSFYYIKIVGNVQAKLQRNTAILLGFCVVMLLFCQTLNLTETWRSTQTMWKRVMRVDALDPIPVIQLGLIEYLESGDINIASQYLGHAYNLAPADSEVLYNCGMFALEQGDFERAESMLTQLVSVPKHLKKFPYALLILVKLYALKGNFSSENALLSNEMRIYYPHALVRLQESLRYRHTLFEELKQSAAKGQTQIEKIWGLFDAGAVYPAISFAKSNSSLLDELGDISFINLVFAHVMNSKRGLNIHLDSNTLSHPFFRYMYPIIESNLHIPDDYFEQGKQLFSNEPLFWLEFGMYCALQLCDMNMARKCLETLLECNPYWEVFPRVIELRRTVARYEHVTIFDLVTEYILRR